MNSFMKSKQPSSPLYYFSFFLVILLLLPSCKNRLIGSKKNGNIPDEITYSTVSASSKASIQNGKKKTTVKTSIRMEKDSLFWCSVSVPIVGEAARMLVSADSAKLLTKLPKKQYYPYSVTEFSERYGLTISPFIIQDLLVGNKILKSSPQVKEKLKKEEGSYVLEQKLDVVKVKNYISSESTKINQVTIECDTNDAMLQISYDDFAEVQERVVPKKIKIQLTEDKNDPEKTLILGFEISKIDFEVESQSYPFRVSSKYQKMH